MAMNRSNKRQKSGDTIDKSKMSFTPRDYQIEILEEARKENTIACLGTGTGKTFIAVMLIRESANDVRIPYKKGGRRIFFLVPTVPLVIQQTMTIQNHTDLKTKGYCGEMDVDSWNQDRWTEEFTENEVLVMTAEIFRIIVDHAFIPLKKIALIIFDECHRAIGDHPYRQALKCFTSLNEKEMPRIFGLSASLLNGKCKPTQVEKNLEELEKTLRGKIATASDLTDILKYGTDPREYIVYYYAYDMQSGLIGKTQEMVNDLKTLKATKSKDSEMSFFFEDSFFFDKPIRCLNSLIELLTKIGPWCAWKAAEMFLEEIDKMLKKIEKQEDKTLLTKIKDFLKSFSHECENIGAATDGFSLDRIPHKLKRLLGVFSAVNVSSNFRFQMPELMDCSFEEDPLEYIRNERLKQRSTGELQLCCIIFVQQRITAYVLCEWLKEVKKRHPQYEFINPNYVVGHGSMGSTGTTAMSEKLQRKTLAEFREEKCNILIATCVLEEGMDIRQCNVVVRFDLPNDYRSYVQSKGRARAENSIYVMLVEDNANASKFIMDICDFKTIEKIILTRCHNRVKPSEEESNASLSDDLISPYMPYGPMGPRITMTSSISLINRYCSNLPSDMATKLVPLWQIKQVDELSIETEYECILKMPINSNLRQEIVSEPMRQRRLAKMSAALKACIELDQIGELNDHLVPKSSLVEKALEDELGELEQWDGKGAQPGTNRRRQPYEKRVPLFLKDGKPKSGQLCFLHVLEMNLVEPLPKSLNPRDRPIVNPRDSPRGLALLTSKKLPGVNSFRIFTKAGKIEVAISVANSCCVLTTDDIQIIEEFHQFLFTEALWMKDGNKRFIPNSSSYYIVPVNKDQSSQYSIDWMFMKTTKEHPYHKAMQRTNATVSNPSFVFSEEVFTDAVVLRSYKMKYWKHERPTFHHVARIMRNLSPLSILNGNNPTNLTYKEYFKKKYGANITCDDQPLMETVQHGSLALWKPLYVNPKEVFEDDQLSKSKLNHKNYREYLVPELSIVHPFPSSFFQKVVCLPTVLFRLNGLLLAEEIRQNVARFAQVGPTELSSGDTWPPFCMETSDKKLRDHLSVIGELKVPVPVQRIAAVDVIKKPNSHKILSFTAKIKLSHCLGPDPSLLLQALTAKSAGDEFDLERLEMIGDSFLKYTMSVKTYFKYHNYDEGKLTQIRSALIQNLRLYTEATKKKLGEYLTTVRFCPNSTWLAPCYWIKETIDEDSLTKKTKAQKKQENTDGNKEEDTHFLFYTKQAISDKCVADSVEALIGCYLLTSGQIGALKFMQWLGLKPLVKDKPTEKDFLNWPPSPSNPILVDLPNVDFRLAELTNGFEKFEEIIGYKFRNRAFLLQAFTHPSYSYNNLTDCYQRLEFLGDAVLDYLVTRQLYEDPTDHSPGELTDLRSALVNNNFFASLAVKYRYNEFLKMLAPKLFGLVDRYIKDLKDSKSFQFFVENGYMLEEIECFELEEVEVPKALGDIFESVAGAIYLDSGMSLDAVWNICFPMFEPTMNHLSLNVPKSPVRELYEMAKDKAQNIFGDAFEKNGKTFIQVEVQGKTFLGTGPNKKTAKRSAAKRALQELKYHGEMRMDI